MDNTKRKAIIGVAVVAAGAGLAYWYINRDSQAPKPPVKRRPNNQSKKSPVNQKKDLEWLKAAIKANFILRSLSKRDIELLVRNITYRTYEKGQVVTEAGTIGEEFYILVDGTLDVYVPSIDQTVEELVEGATFGELALLHNEPRNATLTVSSESVTLGVITKPDFSKTVGQEMSRKKTRYKKFLKACPILQSLTDLQIEKIAEAFVPEKYKDGEVIVQQDDTGDKFYIIKSGHVKVVKNGKEIGTRLNKGMYFGEKALIERAPRAATLIADGRVQVLSIDARGFFVLFLGTLENEMKKHIAGYAIDADDEEKIAENESLYEAIDSNFVLQTLARGVKQKLSLMATREVHEAGDVLFKAGDPGDFFYLVDNGVLECYVDDQKEPREVFTEGSSFGELALLHNEARNATVKVADDNPAAVWAISKDDFQSVVSPFMQDKIGKYRPVLDNVEILNDLDQLQKDKICEALQLDNWEAGDFICRQGEDGDRFYLIESGSVKIIIDNEEAAELQAPKYFGEIALVESQKRRASVRAGAKGATTLSIDSHGFFVLFLGKLEEVLRQHIGGYLTLAQIKELILDAINNNFILQTLSEDTKKALVDASSHSSFSDGEFLIKKGEIGDQFYVIEEGQVGVYLEDDGKQVEVLEKGTSFGELALLHDEPRNASIRALGNVVAAAINKDMFLNLVQEEVAAKVDHYKQFLSTVDILQGFSELDQSKIAEGLLEEKFNAGEVIIHQGDDGDRFYMILDGVAEAVLGENQVVKSYSTGDYFGERALVTKEVRAATVRVPADADTSTTLVSIGARGFFVLFLDRLQAELEERIASYNAVNEE